jgi:hypothetical protein
VRLKIENNESNLNISNSGEYRITAAISSRNSGDFLHCEIISSADFCPAKVTDSQDERELAIIIDRFELARDDPLNVVHVMRLPKDGKL